MLTVAAVAAVFDYAYSELSALVWHVRHGFHTEVWGTRLLVPLSYEADEPNGLPSLSITKLPGHFSGAWGVILIDLRSRISPEGVEAADALARQRGIKAVIDKARVGERPAVFAGRQGKCVEYRNEVVEYRLQGFEIVCGFEGEVSVQFLGSPKLKDDFYRIIQSAEAVKGKS
ncbi:MAG TPA: hypothetical protein VFR84_14750 [Candidatus Angelobacter sp.]|nr:hypothetical protein [Candidatus Angelobacter sp.]